MRIKFLFSFAVLALVFTSCTKNDVAPNEEMTPDKSVTEPISQEGIEFMESLSVNLEDAELITTEYPDGTTEEVYLVEGDIIIHKDQYEEMKNTTSDAENRQWRTGSLVNNWQTIDVLGWNANNTYGLTPAMRTGLIYAVWNFNNLNMGLNFTYSFGTNSANYDIVVYRFGTGAGGSAGFPSGGKPYKWVKIQSGLDNAPYNTTEHVIAHEIGHCIGMRHNDWFGRSSCNGGWSVETPTIYHIWGTPWGEDNGSLFNACYPSGTNGEFNSNDRKMLESMY